MGDANAFDLQTYVPPGRLRQLQDELRAAWEKTPREDLQKWGTSIAADFGRVSVRRIKNLGRLLFQVGRTALKEGDAMALASKEDRLTTHFKARAKDAIDAAQAGYQKVTGFAGDMKQAFKNDPKEAGVQFATMVIASVLVSGGADGDGGAPDLDLAFGIDAHRSFLTHSVLMGAALETGVLALLKLVQLSHRNLPDDHDPIWDSLHSHASGIALSAAQGVSIGMAYHLMIDGLAQPAPYHDLPISMPIEAHQAVFVANAVGEVVDTGHKSR